MWVHDYRPDIRAVVGEVEVPLVQTIIVGVTIGMAVMALSLWMLKGGVAV